MASSRAELNTVQQLLLNGEPISAAELREMTVRHILSAPNEAKNAPTTKSLFDAYAHVYHRDHAPLRIRSVDSEDEADKLMSSYFTGVTGAEWKWPEAIPRDLTSYPRDVLVEVATALGVRQS